MITINSGATLKFTATVTLTVTGDMVVNGTFSSATTASNTGTFAFAGNLTNNGTIDFRDGTSTSRVVNTTFNNTSSDQTITGSPTLTQFYGVTLSKGSSTRKVICSINASIDGGSSAITYTSGTWEQSAGTVTFGSGNQGITSNGGFELSGSGSASFPSSITGSGGSGGVAGTFTVNTSGTLTVGVGNNRLEIGTGGTGTFTAGTVTIGGRLTFSGGSTTINGASINVDPQQSSSLGATSHVFEVSGTANLTFSSGTLTLVDPISATGTGRDILISSSGTVNFSGGTINIGDGSSTSTGGDGFEINNSTSNALYNLTIQTGGLSGRAPTLLNNLMVDNTLTLTSGNVSTGSNTLTIGGSGSVSRTSGYIIGNLKRVYSSTGSKVFDLGTANGYSPVTVNAISGTGDFTVKATQGAHPNAAGTNVLGRYWTLTNNGISEADLTFNYLQADVTGTEGDYVIGKYNGGFSTLSGTFDTDNNTFSKTGVTSFSDWTAGEQSSLITVSVGDKSVTEGNSGTTDAKFVVTLSGAAVQDVTVNFETANNTATTADGDYTSTSGSVTIEAGTTTDTITVVVNGDSKFETNETFFVNLTGATNATITDSQGEGTITNDDSQPSLSIDNVSADEGNAGSSYDMFTVSISNPSYQTITVDYNANDVTALLTDNDYVDTSGTLTFPAGSTASQTLAVRVLGDTRNENNETFTVDLSNVSNATLADDQGVGTIQNDDAEPSVSIGNVTMDEGDAGTTNFNFNVSLSAASGKTVSVNYSTEDGSADDEDGDYDAVSTSVSFDPDETSKNVTITVNGDLKYENNENFFVNLTSPTNATLGDDEGEGTITNDDDPPMISIGPAAVTEGNSGSAFAEFTVTLSEISSFVTTMNYNASDGTALLSDNDYVDTSGVLTIPAGNLTGTISVRVLGDNTEEPNETFLVELSDAVNGTFADSVGVGTINNDDGTPTVSINNVSMNEGNSGKTTTTFGFTVSLSNPSSQTITVNYTTANGSATTADDDYESASGLVTFDPGETTQPIDVTVNGDTKKEPEENFYVILSDPSNAEFADSLGEGTIQNDDGTPSITIGDIANNESNSGTSAFTFTVSLSNPTVDVVTVLFQTEDGTALLTDNDYVDTSGTLYIAPGNISNTFSVSVKGDTKYEANETFFVNLSDALNATIADDQGQATINNDDPAPTLAISDVTLNEGNSGQKAFEFIVTLSGSSELTTTVEYTTSDSSAKASDNDYVSNSNTLTFLPGVTSDTIVVLVNGDTKYELNEVFHVNLSNPSNATIADGLGRGIITNDDTPPALSINNVSMAEGNGAVAQKVSGKSGENLASFVFTVSLTQASGSATSVHFKTADGTATNEDSDYDSTGGILIIPEGETSGEIIVQVNGDTKYEVDENFFVNLSNPTNATIADNQGVGTIQNDDALPTLSISDVSISEGNSGNTEANFVVNLSEQSSIPINVQFTTVNGSAIGSSEVQYTIPLRIVDNGTGVDTIYFGIHPEATYCTDPELGEGEIPPPPPPGIFDVRFSDPRGFDICMKQGLYLDLRPYLSPSQIDTYLVRMRPGDGGYPFTLSWPSGLSALASNMRMIDNFGGTFVDVDMLATTSISITNESVTSVYIISTPEAETSDYISTDGELTFNPGQTSKTIMVQVIGETLVESDENFFVHLSDPVGVTFSDSIGECVIQNDDSYTITASAGPHGTIEPSGIVFVAAGDNQTFTMNPDQYYIVDSIYVDGEFVDSTETYTFYNVDADHTLHVVFGLQPVYAATYRTATMNDWATAVDAKGKAKAIKCKPNKVEFKFQIQAPKEATGVTVKIGQMSSGSITNTDKTVTLASWSDAKEVTYTAAIESLQVLQLQGWGTKGKAIKASFVWATSPKATKGKVTSYILNNPRLPMPNLHNVGNEITLPITIGNASGASSVKHAKYKDVQKSLNSKGTMHTGAIRCLDENIKGKPISKQLKSLDPVKTQNNKLFAEVLTLGLNLAASVAEKFPGGLGNLKWDNQGVFKDSTVNAIYAAGNSYLGCDTSGLNSITGIGDSLYNTISTINGVFAGTIDTVAWSCNVLEMSGVKNLLEVTILKPSSPEPPLRTGPKPIILNAEPTQYALQQNYPNPFNPTTTISYDLVDDAIVTLKIYNMIGQEIATLLDNEVVEAGENEIDFDATGLPSGVYFYRVNIQPLDEDGVAAATLTQVKKMMLLK
jgi:hypothetical protein